MLSDKKNNKGLLDVILNTVSDWVTLIDKDLRIQYHNKVISQSFAPKFGEYCYKAYRGRKTPCEDCFVLEVIKDGKERRAIVDVPSPDGSIRLMEVSSAPIRDESGNITGAVEVARDVTAQKKAEALLNKTLLDQSEDLKRLNDELSDAAGYVKTVIPKAIRSGPVRTDWRFVPSASLGGDSFGYHWIDEDHFAVYLLDVSGHGWGAALLSVSVINVLRSHALPNTDFRDPQEVLFSLNSAFPGEQHNDMFFTIWYGVYNKSTKILVYSSGGHPPALLIPNYSHPNSKVVQLKTPGFLVGGSPDVTYHKKYQKISSPTRLIVFSDGAYDIKKTDDSIWGLENFIQYILKLSYQNETYLDQYLGYVNELTKKKTFDDDLTILDIVFA